jgi:hypothetical protein
MAVEPYRSADRVFGSSTTPAHIGARPLPTDSQAAHANAVMVHLPIHASWLNQIEIYFSILQRKVLTPADVDSVVELEANILTFEAGYQEMATPFEWKSRADLDHLLDRLSSAPLAA